MDPVRQLRRQVRQLLAKQHQTADALAQAQADLAREKLHSDLRIGIELRRRDPRRPSPGPEGSLTAGGATGRASARSRGPARRQGPLWVLLPVTTLTRAGRVDA